MLASNFERVMGKKSRMVKKPLISTKFSDAFKGCDLDKDKSDSLVDDAGPPQDV